MASRVMHSTGNFNCLAGTPFETPAEVLKDGNIELTATRDYLFYPMNREVKDWSDLSPSDLRDLLTRIMNAFHAIEADSPAAGYTVRFVGSNCGRNPMEAHLYAYNSRDRGTALKMPEVKSACPFCVKVDTNEQLKGFEEPKMSNARVIKSGQGNALIISDTHKTHWGELTVDEQLAMMDTCRRVKDKLMKGPHFNWELRVHIGMEGHQNIPHSHIHILKGTSSEIEYSNGARHYGNAIIFGIAAAVLGLFIGMRIRG